MVFKIKIACCGDNCSFCPRYSATLSNNDELLKEIAVLWKKIGWRDKIDPPEKLLCFGCETFNEECEYNVRGCCIEKKIENCGKCDNYPCNIIEKAFEITQINAKKFRDILSKEEYKIFKKAFFLKKENLDRVRDGFIENLSK
ncbi:MAG: DUF3795 domain-containing protein [Promethearchaeota archaeon]